MELVWGPGALQLTKVMNETRKRAIAVQGGAGGSMQQVGEALPAKEADVEVVAEVPCNFLVESLLRLHAKCNTGWCIATRSAPCYD